MNDRQIKEARRVLLAKCAETYYQAIRKEAKRLGIELAPIEMNYDKNDRQTQFRYGKGDVAPRFQICVNYVADTTLNRIHSIDNIEWMLKCYVQDKHMEKSPASSTQRAARKRRVEKQYREWIEENTAKIKAQL